MGQKFRDEAGNVWEMGADGQPRLVSQGQGGPNVVMPAVQDPRLPYQLQQEQAQAAASRYAAPKAQADATIAQANAGSAGVVASAEAQKAQADAEKAKVELEKLKIEQAKVDPKSGAYKALQDQIDRVNELYRKSLQGYAPNFLNDYIPDFLQKGKGQFDAAAQGLVNPFMAAFRVPGTGSQSDTELRQFLAANTPAQGDSDEVIEEKVRNIQTRLNAERPPEPVVEQPQDKMQLATNGTRDEIDPVLRGVAGRLGKMVSAGASDATIVEFLKKNGVDPANTNIESVLQYRKSPEFKAWQRANPGKAYPIGPEFYTNSVPTSGLQDKVSSAVGSAPGAFALNYMQGVTGRHLDEIGSALGGNGEAINTGTQLTQASNPTASFLGDLTGQATAQLALNRIPGLSRLGQFGQDAVYGAYAGHGEGNTMGGMAANALGGAAGRGLGAAGGVALRGVTPTPGLAYLNKAEVPLTIGQIGRGSGTKFGDAVGGAEERLAGIWPFDAIINPARQRGDVGFNRAAFKEMGGTGATGSAGVAEGQNLVNNAYNFLDTTNFPVDAQFAGRNVGVKVNLPRNHAGGITDRLDDINDASRGGVLSGRDWQSSIRGVRADRASVKGQPFSDKAMGAMDEMESNLMDLAKRQGPPGTQANLATANNLNARFQTLASALDNGPAQRAGEIFSASRLNDASRAGSRNFGGRVNAMKGNRPFYDLTNAGMEVMPNLTPDSGTAGRALFYSMVPVLGGGGGALMGAASDDGSAAESGLQGAGLGLIPTLAMAAAYSKGGQKGIQKALLGPRPKWAKDFDQALASNPYLKHLVSKRAAGMFGSAAARDIVLYPELDQ